MSQMTGIDSLIYAAVGEDEDSDSDGEGVWTPRMEAGVRFWGYQQSKGKQRMRRYCEGGFTLGKMVDVVGEMFERDGESEWVVLESVRGDDGDVMR